MKTKTEAEQLQETHTRLRNDLKLAITTGDREACLKALDWMPVDFRDANGNTALFDVARRASVQSSVPVEVSLNIARTLIERGADVDGISQGGLEDTPAGSTPPLIGAIRSGSAKMVDLLLDAGADANFGLSTQVTPLSTLLASSNPGGHAAHMFGSLISRGADLSKIGEEIRQSPLKLVINSRCNELVMPLLQCGEDPEGRIHPMEVDSSSAIKYAQGMDQLDIVSIMRSWLDAKAALDAIDSVEIAATARAAP